MKTAQKISLAALMLEVLLWELGRTLFVLPDWAVRLNGVMMLAAMALLAFTSVRLRLDKNGS